MSQPKCDWNSDGSRWRFETTIFPGVPTQGDAMRRKKKKRDVHYVALAYRDGAVIACYPERKPSDKKMKEDGLRIDPDLVFRERHYRCDEFRAGELEQRVRTCDLLSNRINTRRALREIVLPRLDELETKLDAMQEQLDRMEKLLTSKGL